MINVETVKLSDGTDVKVSEVKVRKVMALLPFLSAGEEKKQDKEKKQEEERSFQEKIEDILKDCCGLTLDELQDLYSSDYEKLWSAFQNVNGFFFKTIKRFNLEEMARKALSTMVEAFGETFADSLKGDMSIASISDLVGSSKPSESPNR